MNENQKSFSWKDSSRRNWVLIWYPATDSFEEDGVMVRNWYFCLFRHKDEIDLDSYSWRGYLEWDEDRPPPEAHQIMHELEKNWLEIRQDFFSSLMVEKKSLKV